MAATANALLEPSGPFRVLRLVEPRLRGELEQLEARAAGRRDPGSLLSDLAPALEMTLVGAAAFETLAELGLSPPRVDPDAEAEVLRRVQERTGLDPLGVLREFSERFDVGPVAGPVPSMEAVVRTLRSMMASFPIADLEAVGARAALEPLGHRCRVAYDGIHAFLLRKDSTHRKQVGVVGQAFARGALSLSEVATVLELEPEDAVELMESLGYHRAVDALVLDEAKRAELFVAMRADRLERQGRPRATSDAIRRDAVASERLEGVDARRWLHRVGS